VKPSGDVRAAIPSIDAIRRPVLDALMPALAGIHGALLIAAPTVPLVAIGLWWNANTIAHNCIHRPFFRARNANRCFSAYTSLLLGIPQTLWRERHLAHHAGRPPRFRCSTDLALEAALIAALWLALTIWTPAFFFTTYVPGYVIGLALCAIQGHYEHARGTTSHYGWLYNALCFNDGYHVEHHTRPGIHWSDLPIYANGDARTSRWPPLLRIFDSFGLEALERAVIRSTWLQAAVLRVHRTAFAHLLRSVPVPSRICVVGGGLFPRTVLILQQLIPAARITVMDADAEHLAVAERFPGVNPNVTYRHARFTGSDDLRDFDLVVFPLSFQGDRLALYGDPAAPSVIVHDWLWRRRGTSRIVSIFLLKRVNLVRR